MARGTQVWAVNANWNGNGWNVEANSVENSNRWNAANQVFSRHSFLSPLNRFGWAGFSPVSLYAIRRSYAQYIPDLNIKRLIGEIVGSFHAPYLSMPIGNDKYVGRKGLPLGNLTSQLLVNIYMNEFDHFVKHKLKAQHYIRYADDFVILSHDKWWLESILPKINSFLCDRLQLQLHPNKVSISTIATGVDFLGWVHFPDHRVLRTATKRRMMRNTAGLEEESLTLRSYLGMLRHGNAWYLQKKVGFGNCSGGV